MYHFDFRVLNLPIFYHISTKYRIKSDVTYRSDTLPSPSKNDTVFFFFHKREKEDGSEEGEGNKREEERSGFFDHQGGS